METRTILRNEKVDMRCPGIEPGPSAWKADILTTRPTTLLFAIIPRRRNLGIWRAPGMLKNGEPGHRSQCLSHAKRALYHLS